jgi:tRNA threonylcarbamoyl adenosine modification protein YeaZ
MKILALEFSSPQRSVAILNGDSDGPLSLSEVVETGGPAIKAFDMIEEALRQTQLEREQIDCLAIGIGPGSYSGIRSAISLVQGWQLARPIKILGLSSVETLAAQAHAAAISGAVHIVIDAQRNEFYLAGYELGVAGWRETKALRLASFQEVQACERNGELLLGPEITKWFQSSRIFFPRAATLAQLARNRTDFLPGNKIEPIYLRETTFVKAPPPRILPH